MTEPICLTPTEVEGLRELLVFLAVLEKNYYDPHLRIYDIEVTKNVWDDMTGPAKAKLSRLTRHRALSEATAP